MWADLCNFRNSLKWTLSKEENKYKFLREQKIWIWNQISQKLCRSWSKLIDKCTKFQEKKITLGRTCPLFAIIRSNEVECWGKFLLCLTHHVNKSEMHSQNWLFPRHKILCCTNFISCRMQNNGSFPSFVVGPKFFDWAVDDGGLWARMINSCLFTCCLAPKCRHLLQPGLQSQPRLGPPARSAGPSNLISNKIFGYYSYYS